MMALSRSMKNLQHDAAQARRGGGNPNPTGGGMSGMVGRALQQGKDYRDQQNNPSTGRLPGQRAALKTKVMQAREGAGGGMMRPAVPRGPRGPVMPRGGVMGGPAGRRGPGTMAGKPRPAAGTFGFASRGGGGTPALQQGTADARSMAMRHAAAPKAVNLPGATSAADQAAKFRAAMTTGKTAPGGALVGGAAARPPAALAKPRGQSIASRLGGRQGPPARRGGMARALGSGGSRRRMLR